MTGPTPEQVPLGLAICLENTTPPETFREPAATENPGEYLPMMRATAMRTPRLHIIAPKKLQVESTERSQVEPQQSFGPGSAEAEAEDSVRLYFFCKCQ